MSLPEISIRRPVFAWMLMASLVVFGFISFKRLGISQLPDVDFPVVSVSLNLPGAAPEVMESQVLDTLEDSIMQIDGIRSVTSSAQQSSGSIAVEFELGRDINEALQEIENHIKQVRNLLPINLFPPVVRKSNPEDQPIMWLALTSDDPNTRPIDLMIFARNTLQDQFGIVPGVGNIAMGGYVDPALRVWTDLDKMKKYNITSDDVVQAIQREQIEIPAGQISNSKNNYTVRIAGEARSPEEFVKIRINSRISQGPNYKPTLISQVADVEEGTADIRRISRMDGNAAVGLGIIKQHGSNAVQVAKDVRKRLKEIQPLMPAHFHVDVRNDKTRFIKQSVDQLVFTLLLSAILTSIVCYLFLGSWTSTINVLMAIPTSIIGAFIAFYFFNFTLNTFTLLGLSLAIGIVVDDAIMMLENIVRHRELGQGKREAAIKGSNEITFAAVAATIAVVAIFLPVVFMRGIIGRYFLQYGVTVTIAVLLSLLEALTLTPMRCSRYLTVNENPRGFSGMIEKGFKRLASGYGEILKFLLCHRWKTVVVTLVLFIASFQIAKHLPSEMMPAQDQSMFMLRFKLPVGTALGVTSEKIAQVEQFLLAQKEVSGVFTAVGGFGGDAVNQGLAFATLVDPKHRRETQQELIKRYRKILHKKISGMETVVQDLSMKISATRGFPVEFVVQGPDWEKLTELTNEVMSEMKKSKYVVDVNTDVQAGMPEVRLVPNRQKLALHAVSLSTVTSVINTLMGGMILTGPNEYPKGRHRYEIEVRLKSAQREKIPDLRMVKVRNNRGEVIPLSELVDSEVKPSLMLISRLNRSRAITVYANPAPGHSQEEAMQYTEQLARSKLPPGYMLKMIGSSQSYRESFQSLIFALLLGILVSYMVLASQFNSFIHPVSVLMALPFSFSGAFIGLAIGHQSINMYSLIGLILLMGIVKKNSILLVDFTNQLRDEGHSDVHQALLKACPVRLRPILMTSIATVAGALPEALSLGPGAETTIPMAIAIIGGVVASTVLTIFVVPCIYSLLTYFERQDTLSQAS